MMMKQTAKLWNVHFDTGEASYESEPTGVPGQQKVIFIVKYFPQLPAPFLDIIEGYIHGEVVFTNAEFSNSKIERNNPQEWRWNWFYRLK